MRGVMLATSFVWWWIVARDHADSALLAAKKAGRNRVVGHEALSERAA